MVPNSSLNGLYVKHRLQTRGVPLNTPSCYIVSLINIDNWPFLRVNNFQQMNQIAAYYLQGTAVSAL